DVPDLRAGAPGLGVHAVLVEELTVDHPGAIRTLEAERPLHRDLREQLLRTRYYRAERVRYAGHVGRIRTDDEFEEWGAGRNETTRLAAIGLLETVHQKDLVLERASREVDDHLHPLRRTDADALHLHGMLQEVAVGGDRDKGLPVAQEELVEAGARAVQQAETVFPPRNPQERLNDAVDEKLVAQEPVVVEAVVDEKAVGVERPVLEDDGNVELSEHLAARKAC